MSSLGFLRNLCPLFGNNYHRSVTFSRKAQLQLNKSIIIRYASSSVTSLHNKNGIKNKFHVTNLNNKPLCQYHWEASRDLLKNKLITELSIRGKHSKKRGKKSSSVAEELTDDEFDDEDIELKSGADFKESLIKLDSLRMDSIVHVGFGMSRNKVDAAFYKGNILVNGKKPRKKSINLYDGDEIDIVKGSKPENPDFLNVSRVVINIVNYNEDSGKVSVKLRKYNQLLIENPNDTPFERD